MSHREGDKSTTAACSRGSGLAPIPATAGEGFRLAVVACDRTSVGADQLAVRDLMLIDGAMARMADIMGLAITDFDTVGVTGRSGRDVGQE